MIKTKKYRFLLGISILFFGLILSCANKENNISYSSNYASAKTVSNKEVIGEPFSILSWNIQDFGSSKSDEVIEQIAEIVRDYDIVAIQEVVTNRGGARAVAKLADELNRKGTEWDYKVSKKTPSPPYKTEKYAYLWKTSKVQVVGKPWLWTKYKNIIERSPYLIRFKLKKTDFSFLLASYHSRKYDLHPEKELEKLKLLPIEYPNDRILIAGDFNIEYDNEHYGILYDNGFEATVRNKRTTIKKDLNPSTENLYRAIDNIFYEYDDIKLLEANTINFTLGHTDINAARKISDHIPVIGEYLLLE